MLLEEYYTITAREGELPFDEIDAQLSAMNEVRAVPNRPAGTDYLLDGSSEGVDIALGMLEEQAPRLSPVAIYVTLHRPDCLVLSLEGSDEGSRKVLVRFLEWLAERCPFAVHDEEGRYAHEIDEKGLSAFHFEPWE